MEIRTVAIDLARRSGRLLKENLGHAGRIEFKGEVDIVTEMDRKAEALIVEELKRRFPDHGILTEESREKTTSSGCRWIIDPLDGTTNYAHGFPVFCVSIAFEHNGDVVFGTVYDPVLDELFVAEKGKGAFMNDTRLRVSVVSTLDKSLLATGFPYDLRTSKENNLDHFANFALRAQAIRRAGSAALDLCYVGCGRFDGFWEIKLHPWDVAVGALVVEEAGGRITDFEGRPFSIYSSECVASNGIIHDEMLQVLKKGQ